MRKTSYGFTKSAAGNGNLYEILFFFFCYGVEYLTPRPMILFLEFYVSSLYILALWPLTANTICDKGPFTNEHLHGGLMQKKKRGSQ